MIGNKVRRGREVEIVFNEEIFPKKTFSTFFFINLINENYNILIEFIDNFPNAPHR